MDFEDPWPQRLNCAYSFSRYNRLYRKICTGFIFRQLQKHPLTRKPASIIVICPISLAMTPLCEIGNQRMLKSRFHGLESTETRN